MNKLLLICLLPFFGSVVLAQEAMEVQRCADIDRYSPIRNIYMDQNNNKWVADDEGLFLAQSPDFARTVETASNEWSLLSAPDGNQELNLPKDQLKEIMGEAFDWISSAHLDKTRDELFIGTAGGGLFRFKVKPTLQALDHWTSKNSKLKSDFIQAMESTPDGTVYVGTDNGMLAVRGGDQDLIVKYFNIEAIAQFNGKIWVIGDQDVLEMDSKGRLYSLEAERGIIERKLKDIDFDSQGRLWIASEIVTRYNFETATFDRFGPAEDFTSQFVNCIAIDADDALWVGTDDKGVYFIGKALTMTASIVVDKELGCDAAAKNAALQVRASGGEPPYNFQWSSQELSGGNPANLGPGTYTVTVTDTQGKLAQAQIEIEDPRLTVNISEDRSASSAEDADGIATIGVSGGKPKYQFSWDNGEKGQTAKRLKAGPHTVTITDAAGCSTTASVTINASLAALTLNLEVAEPVKCNGSASGSIRAVVNGGKEPYQYQFPAGNTRNEIAQNLPAGNYVVTVTDATGNAINAEISLDQPTKLAATTQATAPANLGQKDGKAKSQAQGGTPPYQFKWDNGETGQEAVQLGAGKHLVTITDANGCAITSSTLIPEDILPLSVSLSTMADLNCAGEQAAALKAEIAGGKPPFNFQWNTDKGTQEQANGLGAGDYQVTVSDAAGNQANARITVEAPEAITVTASVKSAANTNAADGKAKANASGGAGKFTYQWDNGETDATAKQLAAGAHTVTVTDQNGCTATASVEITEDILPLSLELSTTRELQCTGAETASLAAEVSGGKGPFQFEWNTTKGNEQAAAGLGAGSYSLTVTDVTGTQATATLNIEDPAPVQVETSVKSSANVNQADGQASAKASGGAGKFTYQWDNGETDATAKQLAAGAHSVTVTDQNGCTATASVEITEDILPLSLELSTTRELQCTGAETASLAAEVSGGKGPFQFEWNTTKGNEQAAAGLGAGSYSLTVTDVTGTQATATLNIEDPAPVQVETSVKSSANVNQADGQASAKASGGAGKFTYQWDNGETDATAKQLAAGAHSVTVTDQNGCTATASVEITEDILPLSLELSTTRELQCTGAETASLAAEVSGGKGPFQFEWNTTKGNEQAAAGLGAGSYSLTVTDVTGTQATATLNIEDPAPVQVETSIKSSANVNQADGQASAKASGGAGKFTYQWDNGETDATAKQLAAGAHSVTVTDQNGCTATASVEITEDILPLSLELSTTRELQCTGAETASLAAEVSGGKGPFQFEWNTTKGNEQAAAGLGAGSYSLTVTDVTGTQATATLNIEDPAPVQVETSVKSSANVNQADGQASAKASGGAGKFTYQWDNGETDATAKQLAAGAHTVTVTDQNGCTATASVEITEDILPLTVSINKQQPLLCAGDQNAGLTVEVSGGKGPFSYQWSTDNGQDTKATGLGAGEYSVTVIDAAGSSAQTAFTVEAPKTLSGAITVDAPANTNTADGKATIRVEGGTKPYQYQWDNGETSSQAVKLAAGDRSVTVTDKNGCTAVANIEITEDIQPLIVELEPTAAIKCAGEATAALSVQVSGGKPPYQYNWSAENGSATTATALAAGNYQVTVTDVTGTEKIASVEVSAPAPLNAEIDKNKPTTNENTKDGKASLKITGGTQPYRYNWDNEETTAQAKGLAFGEHRVTVTDANGCSTAVDFETKKKIMPALTAGRIRRGQTLQVSNLFFEADSTDMTPESYPSLNEIVDFMEESPKVVIEVGGHTNDVPPHEYCDALSSARAKSVADYITTQGIDPNRVFHKGYGKRKPKFSNRTAEGRRKNQRVEIKILQLQ